MKKNITAVVLAAAVSLMICVPASAGNLSVPDKSVEIKQPDSSNTSKTDPLVEEFRFSIGDDKYTLPVNPEELMGDGWEKTAETEGISENQNDFREIVFKKGNAVMHTFVNKTGKGQIIKIVLNGDKFTSEWDINENSSFDDIKKLETEDWKRASFTDENSVNTRFEYTSPEIYKEFETDRETGKLLSVTFSNPSLMNLMIKSDLDERINKLNYGEKVMSLPFSLSFLTADGWNPPEKPMEKEFTTNIVPITKDNDTVSIYTGSMFKVSKPIGITVTGLRSSLKTDDGTVPVFTVKDVLEPGIKLSDFKDSVRNDNYYSLKTSEMEKVIINIGNNFRLNVYFKFNPLIPEEKTTPDYFELYRVE